MHDEEKCGFREVSGARTVGSGDDNGTDEMKRRYSEREG